ncbi:MAG: 1-acyl-sn-glycerol-3-phosphate acyltransferase [Deltaproteobacteria bacterium]|jgi:1-acyl-sn-glycerol-3-phosphate acyltransferase|nr:1-acyl-sn-glycerol-3-phosphate acyltransferase [Deltaproteobacteria bacterium]MBW2496436.1 1-acyl-sn-glycerol-3-phosphate acyltransferase [Deltaproteobacteria bacterium]
MTNWAGSLIFWGFVLVSSLILFPISLLLWLVSAPLDRRRRLLHRFTCLWASLYTWLNPFWRVRIEGRERLHESGPAVLVANHLSLVDILVLFRLQTHFKWVSKIENFRVPLVGWNMTLCGYIPLRRGDARSARAMMEQCDRALRGGSSIMMFPEGTRSASGRLRSFKTGAFELARNNRLPIQPIVIRGTAEALPKRGFVLQGRHRISLEVLEPIPPERFAGDEPDAIAEHVRGIFIDALGKAKRESDG